MGSNLVLQLLAFNASLSSVLACKYVDSTRFSVLSCLMQREHFDSLSQGLMAEVDTYPCFAYGWCGCFVYTVILDEAIVRLKPDFFLLGGGEVSLKLAIRTLEFIQDMKNRHFHQCPVLFSLPSFRLIQGKARTIT
ncbi:hypothetical protein POTOM_004547 [Populus tomentosa]|uniref:Uncharacterized protein n=1 Tax=Populus tomentosa TaxID=118781 RepID=A0A8X8DDJ3_POPTO|nr:hypothetical protein POTOM_004547 [Populus tomentosa]